MKIQKTTHKDFILVSAAGGQVILSINKEFLVYAEGPYRDAQVRLSKAETTRLIAALKSQRKRKGVR